MTMIVGISGPSSSGKTTIARLLRSILQKAGKQCFIVHEDDFYVTDKDIPIHKATGLQDWDCLEAIDVTALEAALTHIKTHASLPPDLQSKEDQNSVGKVDVQDDTLTQLEQQSKLLQTDTIAIIDGFMLFTPPLNAVYSLMDVRLFLPVTRELMIKRRAARSGYVTLEGFWEDPPEYVEQVVWPNYAKDHAFLFEHGDVEGQLKDDVVQKMKLSVAPRAAMQDMTLCLKWAWNVLESHAAS